MSRKSIWVLCLLGIIPVLFSCLVLVFCYPFLGSADGWTRWQTAMIWAEGRGWPVWYWTDMFPPLMSLLMGSARKLSGEFGYYTFLQLFAVSYSFSLLLWRSLPGTLTKSKILLHTAGCSLFLLNPVIINRSAQMFPEALLAVGLILLATLLCDARKLGALSFYTRLVLVLVVCVGMRYNTLAVVPPLVMLAAYNFSKGRRGRYLHLFAALALVGCTSVLLFNLPRFLKMTPSHNLSYILVWDYVGIVLECENPKQQYAIHDILEFDQASELYRDNTINGLQWSRGRIDKNALVANLPQLKSALRKLIQDQPMAFLRLKAKRALGLMTLQTIAPRDRPFAVSEYSDWGNNTPVDIEFEPINRELVHLLNRLSLRPGCHWLFRPPFVIGLAVFLLLGLWKLQLPLRLEGALLSVGIMYYLTFWLVTPEITYRYFFTTYVLLTALSWIAAIRLIRYAWTSLSEKSTEPAHAR